jgi:hypothetical protein
MFRTTRIGLIASIGLLISIPCATPAAQHHTGYVHTLEDLRMARALLQRPDKVSTADGSQDEVSLAISSIDGATSEIGKEAPAGDKQPQDAPKFDTRMSWSARLSMSFKMLDRAMFDCSKEKDNSGKSDLQSRVLASIEQARDRIRVAIDTVNFDYSARNMDTRND